MHAAALAFSEVARVEAQVLCKDLEEQLRHHEAEHKDLHRQLCVAKGAAITSAKELTSAKEGIAEFQCTAEKSLAAVEERDAALAALRDKVRSVVCSAFSQPWLQDTARVGIAANYCLVSHK